MSECRRLGKVFEVLLAICAVCDFQSRLRKKTKMKLFILSGLKNRMEKVAASSPVAKRQRREKPVKIEQRKVRGPE